MDMVDRMQQSQEGVPLRNTTQYKDYTRQEFLDRINEMRLSGGWYQFMNTVEGVLIAVKGYGTWLQVYNVEGTDYSSPMDMKVGDWKEWLAKPFADMDGAS